MRKVVLSRFLNFYVCKHRIPPILCTLVCLIASRRPSSGKEYLDCTRDSFLHFGVIAGFPFELLGNMLFNAVQFIVYGQMKEAIGHGEILSLPQTFFAGAVTGMAVTFVETPMDLFKSQLQVQIVRAKDNPEYKAQFSTVGGAIKQIIKTNGILGCYQGFCTTLIRDTIGVSLYFGFYEIYRRALLKKGQPLSDMQYQGSFTQFMAGGVAGVAYWGCIYPLAIVKVGRGGRE